MVGLMYVDVREMDLKCEYICMFDLNIVLLVTILVFRLDS